MGAAAGDPARLTAAVDDLDKGGPASRAAPWHPGAVVADKFLDLLCHPARWASWLILPLMLSVLVGVAAAKLGYNTILSWHGQVPLFGRAITVNSLLDFQWHVLALLVLFGGILAYRTDRHVAVETVAANLPPRLRTGILAAGDLLFLAPFCAIIAYYAWFYTATAWRTAEASAQGGLTDRWLIKGAMPVAFAMLGTAGVVRGLARAWAAIRGRG
jgi:TRAP-type mannitol/chloroaromatic compound transport system permease small subunit